MKKLSWICGAAILLLLLSFQATAEDNKATAEDNKATAEDNDDVVSLITDELDVSSSKARGGAGAIFAFAKDNLSSYDFDKIAEGIPEMDSLLDAAPEVDDDSLLGGISDTLNIFDDSLGGRAFLAESFDELNMDRDMVTEFLEIIYDYVESASGERAMDSLEDLFLDEL